MPINKSFAMNNEVKTENKFSDERMKDFLNTLDEADNVEVTDWEAKFLESTLNNNKFSDKQAMVIGRLIDKYAHKIKW